MGVSVQILTHPLSRCCLDCADCRAPSHDRMLPGIQHERSAPLNLDSPPISICQDLHTDPYSPRPYSPATPIPYSPLLPTRSGTLNICVLLIFALLCAWQSGFNPCHLTVVVGFVFANVKPFAVVVRRPPSPVLVDLHQPCIVAFTELA